MKRQWGTTDRPTKTGWYWWESNTEERAIAYVECYADASYDNVRLIGADNDQRLDAMHGNIAIRWKGPLKP